MSVSIIIPTRNGGDAFRELLAALSVQTLRGVEMVVVDSGSEDDTVAQANHYGAKVHHIDPGRFDHGGTRTLAAEMAAGEILVFLTQDVLPATPRMLDCLLEPLRCRADIAVSYARQLPAFDADEIAAHLRSFNYPEQSSVRTYEDRHRLGFRSVFVSNSCAAYRRSSLARVGYFQSGLIFGEDSAAAGRLLASGARICYTAEATVYHSHNYSWAEEFRRYFDIGVFHQTCTWLLDTYGGAGSQGLDYIRSGLTYLWRRRSYSRVGDFMVRVGLKSCGYRLGRAHRLLPVAWSSRLSMNRGWWERGRERNPGDAG